MFQTEIAHLLRSRADEYDAVRSAGFSETRILAQKSIAGVDRLSRCPLCCVEQSRNGKITLCGRRRSYAGRFIRLLDVQGVTIRFRIDCN